MARGDWRSTAASAWRLGRLTTGQSKYSGGFKHTISGVIPVARTEAGDGVKSTSLLPLISLLPLRMHGACFEKRIIVRSLDSPAKPGNDREV